MTTPKPQTALGGRFLAGTAAVIALLGSAVTAAPASVTSQSPVASFAARASHYQNSVIGRAMDLLPGGTRVSAGEAEWAHGRIILKVPASPAAPAIASCPGDTVCVWTATGYSGGELQIDDSPPSQSWIRVGLALNAEESVINQTGDRYWMEQFQNHGNELCLNPGQDDPDVNTANDHDYWGLVTLNPNNC